MFKNCYPIPRLKRLLSNPLSQSNKLIINGRVAGLATGCRSLNTLLDTGCAETVRVQRFERIQKVTGDKKKVI